MELEKMTKNKKQPERELPKSSVVQMVLKYAWKSRKAFIIMLLAMIAGSVFSAIVPRVTETIINGLEANNIEPGSFLKNTAYDSVRTTVEQQMRQI